MFENKYYVYAKNKLLFHAILFLSFISAIKLIPIINGYVVQYIDNALLQQILPYLIAYIGAIYLLPELGFALVKSFSDKQE